MDTKIHVCRGCKPRDNAPGGEALLASLLVFAAGDADVEVVPYPCLGPCGAPGRVVLSGPGRWCWLFAGLAPGADVDALGNFLATWRQAPAGLVPKIDRPERLRPKILGRVPPLHPADSK